MALLASVRAKIKELEPQRAVFDAASLAERMGNEYFQDRLRTAALALFGAVALSLASLGVYGTLSYVVSLRRREVGLRVALGAPRRRIIVELVGKALSIVGVACIAGLALSFAFSKLLEGMLYGVSSADPLALGSVVALVTGVAAVAALVPAHRASRLDPMTVLRED
jgi:ABC-type antimicrobial peptide transport system permease subunit